MAASEQHVPPRTKNLIKKINTIDEEPDYTEDAGD